MLRSLPPMVRSTSLRGYMLLDMDSTWGKGCSTSTRPTRRRGQGGDTSRVPVAGADRRPEPVSRPSLADSQAVDHFKVLLPIVEPQVLQQARPLGDHHQQPAAAGMVLGMGLEVFGQIIDP